MGGQKHPDGVKADLADRQQLATYEIAQSQLADFAVPVLLSEDDPKQRLFFAAFDGTGNSRHDARKLTNVAQMYDQVRRHSEDQVDLHGSSSLQAGYVEGPGTQDRWLSRLVDKVTGRSYEARLEEMYLQFVTQSDRWLKENPDADIRLFVTGFSRGGEQSAGFTRMVEDRGIQSPEGALVRRDKDGLIVPPVVYPAPPLREPGTVIQSVGLFDPVGTGEPKRHDRRPASAVVVGFNIEASLEKRNLFSSTAIIDRGATEDGRFLSVKVAGAHSDIGGGYQRNGLAIMSGNLMIDFFNAHVQPPPLEKRALPDDPEQYVIHRSQNHSPLFGTSHFDRTGERRIDELLAPPNLCRIDCRDAMPRNETMAASVPWRPVMIGPVQGAVPVRSEGLDTRTFANGLLSAAAREDGIMISGMTREQIGSGAGQTWLQSGFDALERQSREFAERASAQPAPAMEAPAL